MLIVLPNHIEKTRVLCLLIHIKLIDLSVCHTQHSLLKNAFIHVREYTTSDPIKFPGPTAPINKH